MVPMVFHRWQTGAVLLTLTITLASCASGSGSAPTTPDKSTGDPTPLTIDLPIRAGDNVAVTYGIWPYGVHGGGHAIDGHPGFDFEYRVGSPVVAAADGVVDSTNPDAHDPTRVNIRLRHHHSVGDYLTDYSNLVAVPANLVPGVVVTRGQILGTAGASPGGGSAMTHFQLGDPTHLEMNMIIASPENYLTASARAQLDEISRTAAWITEFCEPMLTNVRANGFPMSRTWTKSSGSGPATIDVVCPADGASPQYTFRDSDRSTLETGTMRVTYWTRPGSVDFLSAQGPTTSSLYDIVGGIMQLLSGTYTTK